MPDVVREPQVRIQDWGRSKQILVVVELPGVESLRDVYAMLSDPTPLRSTLHVRVRGMYSADIQLPAKIHERREHGIHFNSTTDNQDIAFTLSVSEPPVERPLHREPQHDIAEWRRPLPWQPQDDIAEWRRRINGNNPRLANIDEYLYRRFFFP